MTAGAPHLLVIRRRYLGDIVLLGSVLRNLRLHWPGARLVVLVEPAYAGILTLNPDVDATLLLPQRLAEWPAFLRAVRGAGFSHVLDLDNTEKTAALTRFAGAPMRVVLHHGGHRVKLRRAYTHVVHDPGKRHEAHSVAEYYLRVLEPLGVPVATHEVRLEPREADLAVQRRFVGAAGPVLLVHPGSRSPCRLWPAERFAAVCDHAQDELGAQVVLVGGPAERPLLAKIRGHARSHLLTLDPSPTLPQLAALARLSAVFLCHDSGPMHIAAAVGTPVVALLGSQNPRLFAPAGGGHTLLRPPLPCTQCAAPGVCVPGDSYRNYCVRNIPVAAVTQALRSVFARQKAPHHNRP